MKKSWNFILIPVFIVIIILIVIVIVLGSTNISNTYHYPFNNFKKVEDTMSLSKNHKNVVYIMVDMTTGFDVTSILQTNKEMATNFTGFTNYLNVITNNWGTNASVPNVFGGYDYNTYYKNYGSMKDITFKNYMKSAMNILINAFGENKWAISTIGNQYYHYDDKKSYWDSNWQTLENDFKQYNLKAINANDISRFLNYQKNQLYQELKLPNDLFFKSSNVNHIAIASYLSHVKIQNTETNKFMTIMDESNHTPIVMNQSGNYQPTATTIKSIYQSTQGFLKKINNFITHLKINNIYDNTMIVIISDHGNNGTGSLPVTNPDYNHTGIDYREIAKIEKKYPGFTRAFPTLLVKPFNKNGTIEYNNNLYTNADALTFIKEYNSDVNFKLLDQTKDIRYLKKLSDIKSRINLYMPSYKNDSLWNDNFTRYLTPDSGFGGYSFLIKNSIYHLNNYLVSKDIKDYYSPEDLNKWEKIMT